MYLNLKDNEVFEDLRFNKSEKFQHDEREFQNCEYMDKTGTVYI